jgi:hypothetical protein
MMIRMFRKVRNISRSSHPSPWHSDMIYKLESIWKEAAMTKLTYYPGNSPQGLGKITKVPAGFAV